jgi:YfiH family protein
MIHKLYQSTEFIIPDWEVSSNVKAVTTTKIGGFSSRPYSSFNISEYVGDQIENVRKNRELLEQKLNLPSSPLWLHQVHGNRVISHTEYSHNITADAIICNQKNIVCSIQSADCLPIIICHKNAKQIAAIHAGWKGLYNKIIVNTIKQMGCNNNDLIAWIGPSISQKAYQVNATLYDKFVTLEPEYSQFFHSNTSSETFADLKSIAEYQLNNLGISKISIANYCTYYDNEYFYSYRRNNITGRQATLIWLT